MLLSSLLQSRRPGHLTQTSFLAYTFFTHRTWLLLLAILICGVAVVTADDTSSSALTVRVNSSVTGTISEPGDVDYWRINVPSAGQLVVETTGTTDTYGVLEDSAGNKLDEHDDQSVPANLNFKIEWTVTAGTYYIRVSAYRDRTGDYTLHVAHTPAAGGGDTGLPEAGVAQAPALGDLNGDGRDDVLLRHRTNGRWYYYPMNGRRYSSGRGLAEISRDLDRQFAGIGDLNGDGRDDVLLRGRTDGRWYYYPMNGRVSLASQRGLANLTTDPDWQFAGIGDLNGDGRDDVLLRHRTNGRWYYYPMNGRRYSSGRGLAEISRDLDRQFAGIGDLNGDGRDDVLLRGRTDGRWYYYPMNGRVSLASQRGLANLTTDPDWQFAGIGDLNGDGRDDVLLRHRTNGRWYYYPMNGRRYSSGRGLAEISRDLDRQFAGIGDLNGDGRDDVLLRGRTDGRWYYYPMNGRVSLASQRGLANLTLNQDWSIASAGSDPGGPSPEPPQEPMNEPDLVVESPSVSDSTLTTGQTFTFSATVRNRGDGRSGSTTLNYYRSTNQNITRSDTRVGTDSVSSLSASGSSSESIRLTAPSSADTYYYGACVDSVSGERNTDNNCSSGVRVTVEEEEEGEPDLVVESPSVSDSTLTTGQTFTFSATVRNRGDGRSGSTTLNYYRSTNQNITRSDTRVGTDSVSSLSASGSSSESIRLTAPSSADTYYYGACVDSVSGERNTDNNCSSGVRVTVEEEEEGEPDLVVESPSVSDSTLTTRQNFTVSVTVRNRGTGRSDITTLRYYRSTNSNISRSDTEVDRSSVSSLSAGGSSSESKPRLHAPSSAGTYYYGACVDSVSGERNTGNNCSSGVRVTVEEEEEGEPDLVVESPSVSDSTLTTRQNFTVSATVRNRGDGRSGSTTLNYYRSTNQNITRSDTRVGTDSVSSLSASGSSSESIRLTAPSSAGTYYYGACVDSVSGESNTGNNCSSAVTVRVENEQQGITARITNNCGGETYLRYFQGRNDITPTSAAWPGGDRVFVLSNRATREDRLGCTPGYLVCYGARNTSTLRYSGVNIDGDSGCTGCCTRCPTNGHLNWDIGNISCPSPTYRAIAITRPFTGCTRRGVGYSGRTSSRADAETEALNQCNSRSSVSCVLHHVLSDRCIANAEGDNCAGSTSGGNTQREAEQSALSGCRNQTRNCRIRFSLCD